MKFCLYLDNKKEWRWTLRASNGRVVADSAEGYKNKAKCSGEVKRIIRAIEEGRYKIVE